jgi:hypothetical protein
MWGKYKNHMESSLSIENYGVDVIGFLFKQHEEGTQTSPY